MRVSLTPSNRLGSGSRKSLLLAVALALGACASPASPGDHAVGGPGVRIAEGRLAGADASDVRSFKGIPFAAAPVGDLRWKPPRPPAKWEGVRDATSYGPACPQPDRDDGGGAGTFSNQSEDCLTLNVWAPSSAKSGAKLPVMVWIHGGAHRLGSGSAALYDGSALAGQGVVLVTINYRLGLLGFFGHPAITADAGPSEPLGNYGLMDQIAALKWVKTNAAAFGGDPDNVTVFGESAGGADIIYLLTTPAACGLFDKAIVQSGGGMQRPTLLPAQEAAGQTYAANLGLGSGATLADLKARSADDWIKAQGALQGGLGFGPFVDGRLVKEAPWAAFREGREADVPLMIGANSNEASVLATLGVPAAALAVAAGDRMSDLRAAYGSLSEEEFRRQAMGDVVFVAPSRWIAGEASDGKPSFLYYFSYLASMRRGKVPGAGHGTEIPYVFQTGDRTPLARFLTDEDRAMSRMMSACWVAFARTGKPSCEGAPAWPAYNRADDVQMQLGETVAVGKPAHAAAFDIFVEQFFRSGR